MEQANKGYTALKEEQQKAAHEANDISEIMRGMYDDMAPRLAENKHHIEQVRLHGVSINFFVSG